MSIARKSEACSRFTGASAVLFNMLSWRRSCDSVSTVASPQLCLVDLSPSVLNDRAQPADCTGQHVTAAGTQQGSAYSLQARGTHRWTPTEWTDSCAAAVGHLGSHVLTQTDCVGSLIAIIYLFWMSHQEKHLLLLEVLQEWVTAGYRMSTSVFLRP